MVALFTAERTVVPAGIQGLHTMLEEERRALRQKDAELAELRSSIEILERSPRR